MLDWLLGKDLQRRTKMLGVFAAGLAFFFILSLVPFVVVVTGLIDFFFDEDVIQSVRELLVEVVPTDATAMVEAMVSSAGRASAQGVWTFTFLLALWTCGNFMAELTKSIRYIFDIHSDSWKGFFIAIARVAGMMGVWALALLSNALVLIVRPVAAAFLDRLGFERGWQLNLLEWAHLPMMTLVLWLAVFLTLVLNGGKKYPLKLLALGALVAALALVTVGFAFSRLLPAIWADNIVYGALGSIVSTMFWAYASAWVLLGSAAFVVRVNESQKRGRRSRRK